MGFYYNKLFFVVEPRALTVFKHMVNGCRMQQGRQTFLECFHRVREMLVVPQPDRCKHQFFSHSVRHAFDIAGKFDRTLDDLAIMCSRSMRSMRYPARDQFAANTHKLQRFQPAFVNEKHFIVLDRDVNRHHRFPLPDARAVFLRRADWAVFGRKYKPVVGNVFALHKLRIKCFQPIKQFGEELQRVMVAKTHDLVGPLGRLERRLHKRFPRRRLIDGVLMVWDIAEYLANPLCAVGEQMSIVNRVRMRSMERNHVKHVKFLFVRLFVEHELAFKQTAALVEIVRGAMQETGYTTPRRLIMHAKLRLA